MGRVTNCRHRRRDPRRRRRAFVIGAAFVAVEAAAVKLRAGKLAGNVVVRCRAGHLFTTIWIPGGSLKSVRLGLWRLQRCPVGGHWSLVTPVDPAGLTDEELQAARENRDIRLP
jgi:hypothetical protein